MGFREPLDPAGMWSNMPPSSHRPEPEKNGSGLLAVRGTSVVSILERPAVERQSLPVIARPGPMVATTCTDLAIDAEVIHDSNFYYRSLGFSWPFKNIGRTALRKAYQDRNGQGSRFLTYSLTQLLDKEIRRLYDRLPFGAQFFDLYVFEKLHRKASDEASESCKKGPDGLSANDVLRAWGLDLVEPEAEPSGAPDEPSGDRDQMGLEDPPSWSWGYCAWRSACDDTDRLERWQGALVRAARRQNKSIKFAVGYVGEIPQDFLVAHMATGTGPMLVIYLHDAVEPTDGLAARAVATL